VCYPQNNENAAIEFLSLYGLENFSEHYIDALESFVLAKEHYDNGEYLQSKSILDTLWSKYPIGGNEWYALPNKPFGINLGTPPCYYALRMLTDMINWRIEDFIEETPKRTIALSVLLIGHTNGIEPQNQEEIILGTGIQVSHDLDPSIISNDYEIVHESLNLFKKYIFAITRGILNIETQIILLPDIDLIVDAFVNGFGGYNAGIQDASEVFQFLSENDINGTDWWWALYPSHVPEQYSDFENSEFITGGMGLGVRGSPLFISDDRWLVRKPPHLGNGEYSKLERAVYLPQWLQHEFFHHLYRTWPEYKLEATGHQWFDLSTWPEDFEGIFEPDYYHESIYKRLHFAEPSLHIGLRYSTIDAPWDQLIIDDVIGTYKREPVENDWHIGEIRFIESQLKWVNTANVQWNLQDDLENGKLLTDSDCPYYGQYWNAGSFQIVLERNNMGDLTANANIYGFKFLGEIYKFDYDNNGLSVLNGVISEDFSISSIYPNPFNPITNIIYGLPEHVNVQIIVYDLSGKQIETLINQFQTPGYHSVDWDANNLPSGIYFVKMVAGSYINTQKLMLVK